MSAPTPSELSTVTTLLSDIKTAVTGVKSSINSFNSLLSSTGELSYPSGISLLSLKNHLHLSYLHHLSSLLSLRLHSKSLTSPEGVQLVNGLVKLRVVLEKIGPLEGKLKYQIEKLVRKADAAAEGGDEEDVVNDPLAFRPNPSALMLDRTVSEDEEDEEARAYGGVDGTGEAAGGIYRPPRIAAMPYTEGPSKKDKKKKPLPSHMLSDLSHTISSSTPYGESTSGLSVTVDPSLSSGTARHLKQVEQYELDNFTRLRMSKKDSKKRRSEEEEVAFGGLGAGKGGKRRLGGFGAEFDDLLHDMGSERSRGAVWVPREHEGYVAGHIVKEEQGTTTVALESGELVDVSTPAAEFDRVNPPTYDGAEDIADLTYLSEASVVHNLKTRYFDDSIYTYSGLFLVAVNPYKTLPIYTSAAVESFKNKRRDENAPHVFAVAEKAWQSMLAHREQSQSILVTGESGAGKTENTKKVIQYLAAIAADPLPPSSSFDMLASRAGHLQREASTKGKEKKKELGQLERQILEANPILEAFGNAQTVKNNNSSRFGKFVRIYFNSIGAIAGANIDWYLLEKSRVTARSDQERGFHIFFQLLNGADASLREKLLLTGTAKDYEYLKHSRLQVDGMDDRVEWNHLLTALDTVGFTPEEQLSLFKVIAAILHLGNITVGGSDTAHIRDPSQLERVCHLLGIPDSSDLLNALVRPKVKAGREWVVQARTNKQVVDELAAMSKALYEKNFGKMVERINKALGRPSTRTFIGVLDIAGFEIFETNGFEQLCINLTNEKLQQFFNHHMFVLEQEEYSRENIVWKKDEFGAQLQPTIDLIESSNPMGILSCLDDACIMPKASDKTFTAKLEQVAKTSIDAPQFSKYTPSRFEQGFTVKHYAGDVEYRTDGWLDKNRDPLSDNLTSLLAHSNSSYIADLFSEYAESPEVASEGPRTRVRKGAFRTVGQRHKDQLAFLMSQLRETQPHFIRCIVPNLTKSPGVIDTPLVLDQLRCNGVLEGIRIARLGYPNRVPFSEFKRRFEVLAPGLIPHGFVDGKEACRKILTVLDLAPEMYQLGLTKVFFKAGILAEIEGRRDEYLSGLFTRVQAACRKFVVRRQANKILNRANAVRTIQRNARIYGQLRAWPWWALFQRVRPLLAVARSDEENRRKAEELAAAKELAEKEALERERLQELQVALEEKQREVEAALASEQARGHQQEEQLRQSKQREAELEEDTKAMLRDIEQFEIQRKEHERRIVALEDALMESRELVQTLQAEQTSWKNREAELASQTSLKTEEYRALVSERDVNAAKATKLKQDLDDSRRELERVSLSSKALESRLAKEGKEASESRKTVGLLEGELRSTKEQVAKFESERRTVTARLDALDGENASLKKNTTALTTERDTAVAASRDLEVKLASVNAQVSAQTRQLDDFKSSQAKSDAELASLQKLFAAKSSDHDRQTQLNQAKETEVQDLRLQVSKSASELASTQRNAANEATRLRQEVDQSRREATDLRSKNAELTRGASAATNKISALEEKVAKLEDLQHEHDLQIQVVRTQAAEDTLRERAKWEKERAELRAQFQRLEDAALASKRAAAAAEQDSKALQVLLDEEKATVQTRDATIKGLNSKVQQQSSAYAGVLKDINELNGELRDTKMKLRLAEDKGGKLVVEHIRVLEETMRLQNLEMEKIKGEKATRDAYVRTLERARTTLNQSIEDLQHERDAERRARWASGPAPDTTATKLAEQLSGEQKLRQEAELNVDRLRREIHHQEELLKAAAAEKTDFKRKLLALEQELKTVAASDHNEQMTYPRTADRRTMTESRAANVPSPTRTTFGLTRPTPAPSASTLPPQRSVRKGYE
ncbi:myosin heavy chain [Pseudohyphozyma bogoriensis]|nr:myosin heavy chain [Pseudohyphozyma bogoriensis]